MKSNISSRITGHVKITDIDGNILLNKYNAIHYENMSVCLVKAAAGLPEGHISTMYFGNGGSVVNGVGQITYLPTNTTGVDADLYNPTFFKLVDDNSSINSDPTRNYVKFRHLPGNMFSDILIRCTLEYNEPAGQLAFDNNTNTENDFVFDEIGLKTFEPNNKGLLISHIIFSPITKSLNRSLQVDYTIRINMC